MPGFWDKLFGYSGTQTMPSDPRFEEYNSRLANTDPGLGAYGKWGKGLLKKFGRGDDVSSYGEMNSVRQQGAANRREVEDSYGTGGNALLAQTGSDQAPLLQRMKEMALDREREREGMALVGAQSDLQRQAGGAYEGARQFRAGQNMQGLSQAADNQLSYTQYLNRPVQKQGWLSKLGQIAGVAGSFAGLPGIGGMGGGGLPAPTAPRQIH